MSIPGKVYSQAILNWIRDVVDTQLREEQAGFRPKRSCAEQIFTLRQIIEKCNEFQCPLALSFIDFSKAFDSLHRPSLWKVLREYGLPVKIVAAIRNIYDKSKCCVRTEDGLSDWFEVITGVRQGCLLSPILFGIAIDWILHRATLDHGMNWVEDNLLSDLDFADDIAALSENTNELQSLISNVSNTANKIGLNISSIKIKKMLVGSHPDPVDIKLENDLIEVVEDFTYLGSSLNNQGDMEREISCRIGKATAAFSRLSKIWMSKKIPLSLKMKFYNSNVISTLLYASETWHMKLSQEKKIDSFDAKCLRKILRIKWSDFISNEEIRRRCNQQRASNLICKRRLNWFGHVNRYPPSRIAKQSMLWIPRGKRKRGRPKMSWKHTIQRDLQSIGSGWYTASRLDANRSRWNVFAASCVSRHGRY